MRRGALTLIVAAGVLLAACKAAPEPRATAAPTPTPAADVAPQTGLELYEIAIAGDRTSVPIALAQTDGGALLFATDGEGVARHAIDLDAHVAARAEVFPLDRFFRVSAYDRAHDRLWWTVADDQRRVHQPSSDGDFPRADLELTLSSVVADSQGLRETIRVCPSPTNAIGAGEPLCDHEIRELLPAFDGVVVGGHFAERVGQASAQAWIGFVDASGRLTTEQRFSGSSNAWIGALAQSDAGVLAAIWSGAGESARVSFSLFRGPALERISTADRATPSSINAPWSAAVAAPDGSFWVVLTTHRHELTISSITRDGAIASEHSIDGAELPISSVQALGLRRGEPWLLITDLYGEPLWAGRIDPTTGAVPEHYEIPLPTDFAPERMLVHDRGFLLAGRVNLERPLAVWIPLD